MRTSPDTSAQIILAAMRMAGDPDAYETREEWEGEVFHSTGQVAHMLSDDALTRVVEVVAGARDRDDETCKCFTGTLVGLKRETSSNRMVLRLRTRPSDRNREGVESLRTEPTWRPAGVAMAERLRTLKNHRLLVYVDMQRMKDGNRVRVLSTFVDLGLDESDDNEN